MNSYYIIEHQLREDGMVNVSEVSRSTYANAVSYYYERYSKMIVNEQFVSVSIMLVNASLDVLLKDTIETQYKPKEEEPVIEEPVEEEIIEEEVEVE